MSTENINEIYDKRLESILNLLKDKYGFDILHSSDTFKVDFRRKKVYMDCCKKSNLVYKLKLICKRIDMGYDSGVWSLVRNDDGGTYFIPFN